jgi:uncharacterized protein
MYTLKQKQLLAYALKKVRALLIKHPTPGHDFYHAVRVGELSRKIAVFEKSNIFLAELSGVLHDIGYTRYRFGSTKSHHEHSYELCREWFRKDHAFDILTKDEKRIILYTLRYHGNDEANLYATAWIIRDADKLDGLGAIGLKRSYDYCKHSRLPLNIDLRLRFHMVYHLKSAWSKKLLKQKKLLKPFEDVLVKLNRDSIKPVTL